MFDPKMFKSMEATAKRALASEAWRMEQKLEVEIPSGVFNGEAEWPAELRDSCPVTDPWVSWEGYNPITFMTKASPE
jgi:hypothetical protein